ncbi:MAG: hypothetical protein ACREIT_05205 [Tepidisphaeraceae bacterium]
MFEGEVVGPANADVRGKKPVATLLDDDFTDLAGHTLVKVGPHFAGHDPFKLGEAFSGGKVIALPADSELKPRPEKPFGNTWPAWDFPIAQNPRPGEYRYLRLAWRGTAAQTMSLVAGAHARRPPAGDAAGEVNACREIRAVSAPTHSRGCLRRRHGLEARATNHLAPDAFFAKRVVARASSPCRPIAARAREESSRSFSPDP